MGVFDITTGRKRQPRPTPVTPQKLHDLHCSLIRWARTIVLLSALQALLLIILVILAGTLRA